MCLFGAEHRPRIGFSFASPKERVKELTLGPGKCAKSRGPSIRNSIQFSSVARQTATDSIFSLSGACRVKDTVKFGDVFPRFLFWTPLLRIIDSVALKRMQQWSKECQVSITNGYYFQSSYRCRSIFSLFFFFSTLYSRTCNHCIARGLWILQFYNKLYIIIWTLQPVAKFSIDWSPSTTYRYDLVNCLFLPSFDLQVTVNSSAIQMSNF